MELTKDAQKMIFLMCKQYKKKREKGLSKYDAKSFGSAQSIQANFFPDMLLADVKDTLYELEQNNLVKNAYGSDTIYSCSISENAIVMIENQSKENFLNVADFISKFIP